MKKGWKIFWISCGAVAAIGLAFCAAGTAMGATWQAMNSRFPNGIGFVNCDTDAGSGMEYSNGEKAKAPDVTEIFKGVTGLDVDVTGVAVQILEADTNSNEVVFQAENVDQRLHLNYYMEDEGVLQIETDEHNFLRNNCNGTLWIYVPKDLLREVDLSVGAGVLYVQNIDADDLSVQIGAGEGTIDGFTGREVDFDCGVGQLTAAGEVEGTLDIECGIGEVDYTAPGKLTDYNYSIDCGIGEVEVGGNNYAGISRSNNIDNHTNRMINIDCGIGSVKVDFAS